MAEVGSFLLAAFSLLPGTGRNFEVLVSDPVLSCTGAERSIKLPYNMMTIMDNAYVENQTEVSVRTQSFCFLKL